MGIERRRTDRVEVFFLDKVHDSKVPVWVFGEGASTRCCLVTDISPHGLGLLVGRLDAVDSQTFPLRLQPVDELGFSGATVSLRKIWQFSTGTLGYYNVGCCFVDLPEAAGVQLLELAETLEQVRGERPYLRGEILPVGQ